VGNNNSQKVTKKLIMDEFNQRTICSWSPVANNKFP